MHACLQAYDFYSKNPSKACILAGGWVWGHPWFEGITCADLKASFIVGWLECNARKKLLFRCVCFYGFANMHWGCAPSGVCHSQLCAIICSYVRYGMGYQPVLWKSKMAKRWTGFKVGHERVNRSFRPAHTSTRMWMGCRAYNCKLDWLT